MRRILGARWSSQANATCVGVASLDTAAASSDADWSGESAQPEIDNLQRIEAQIAQIVVYGVDDLLA
jgi:hypothetical protein